MDPFALNLRHLRALDVIVRLGSLRAAAAAANLSQPTLARGLATLEHKLGQRLFERSAAGMRATPAGLVMASRTMAAFEQLELAARDALRGAHGFDRPEHLMTGTQLRAFLAVADAGGFVGAARTTGLSEPALHRSVRDLERIDGTLLVERHGRTIRLTPAGRRFARGVRLAAHEIAAGISEVSDDMQPPKEIVVGTMPLARARVLPAAIASFIAASPQIRVRVVEGSWRDLVEPLRDGVIDVMIGAMRDEVLPGLEQMPLFDDELVVVARAGHPLAAARAPKIAELARFDWIVAGPGTPLRAQWEGLFAGRDVPQVLVECGSSAVIRGILAKSDLLTLLSPDQVRSEVAAGVLVVIGAPLAHARRTIGVITRTGWRPLTAQARFLAALTAAAAQRVPELLLLDPDCHTPAVASAA
jgi:LysR family transcriptional regulator of gallate degradation